MRVGLCVVGLSVGISVGLGVGLSLGPRFNLFDYPGLGLKRD